MKYQVAGRQSGFIRIWFKTARLRHALLLFIYVAGFTATTFTTFISSNQFASAAVSYYLPYPMGETYAVNQGPGDCNPSHCTGGNSAYAYDFGMGSGDVIAASAPGTLYRRQFHTELGNIVFIQHADGKCTLYAHMSGFSSAVNGMAVGSSQVSQGQIIGYAGSTGSYTSGVHLHFGRANCSTWATESINFVESNYTSQNPGSGSSGGGSTAQATDIHHANFNGSAGTDILWYGPGTDNDRIWYGSHDRDRDNVGFEIGHDVDVSGDYTPVTGDFDGDGESDIVWYAPGTATDKIWYGSETIGHFENVAGSQTININGTYTPISGDFNDDGKSDILWYGPGTAGDAIWYGTNRNDTFIKTYDVSVSGVFEPISGDFDADGNSDILWYGPGTAPDKIWYGKLASSGGFDKGESVGDINGVYKPVAGNFNGSAGTDILWYGPGTDNDRIWYGSVDRDRDDVGFETSSDVIVNGTYETPIAGDFDADGRSDILWYGPGTADDGIWYGTSTKGIFHTTESVGTIDSYYTPVY